MPTTDNPAHIQPRLPSNPRPAQRLKLEHNDANIASGDDSTRSPTVERDASQAKQPAKRARKAINCEPCRNSKLKCDRSVHFKDMPPSHSYQTTDHCYFHRGRPCSSCVLRGSLMKTELLPSSVHPHAASSLRHSHVLLPGCRERSRG